jgi:hypothetical protein
MIGDEITNSTPATPSSVEALTDTVGTMVDLPPGGGTFSVGVVGESYRQHALKALAGDRRQRGEQVFFSAVLVPEPTNQFDSNAVRVHIQGGAHVGYLSREDAIDYRAGMAVLIARHAAGLCPAKLIGGGSGKPTIGVVLDLASPDVMLSAVAPNEQPF